MEEVVMLPQAHNADRLVVPSCRLAVSVVASTMTSEREGHLCYKLSNNILVSFSRFGFINLKQGIPSFSLKQRCLCVAMVDKLLG
jgi:hypothetical protein